MSSRLKKTTVYLFDEEHRALQQAARREGRSQAEMIREAVAQYLGSLVKPRFRSLGRGADPELYARDSEGWIEKEWLSR